MGLDNEQPKNLRPGATGSTAFLALMVLLLGSRVVLAAQIGIPGPPQPPCISTAPLDSPLVPEPGSIYWCMVRNAGAATHNVSIHIRTQLETEGSSNSMIAPGTADNAAAGHFTPMTCVVTTAEETTAALQDLAVVLEIERNDGSPVGETTGKLFQQCPPSKF